MVAFHGQPPRREAAILATCRFEWSHMATIQALKVALATWGVQGLNGGMLIDYCESFGTIRSEQNASKVGSTFIRVNTNK